jgi:hypothetical protein
MEPIERLQARHAGAGFAAHQRHYEEAGIDWKARAYAVEDALAALVDSFDLNATTSKVDGLTEFQKGAYPEAQRVLELPADHLGSEIARYAR